MAETAALLARDGVAERRDDTVSASEVLEGPSPERDTGSSSNWDPDAAKLDADGHIVPRPANANSTEAAARLRDWALPLQAEYALPLVE